MHHTADAERLLCFFVILAIVFSYVIKYIIKKTEWRKVLC